LEQMLKRFITNVSRSVFKTKDEKYLDGSLDIRRSLSTRSKCCGKT
jgi:hypothetical protein